MKAAQTRLNDKEYKQFQAKAKSLGHTIAAYLRKLILDDIKEKK